MDKLDLIAIRDWNPEQDKNFILSTWLRGLYYGNDWFRQIKKDIFMNKYHAFLENLLAQSATNVQVACLREDPEVILGYSVLGANHTAHWTFVKSAWRNIGIAKSLIPADTETVTHLTKVGLSIINKHPNVVFNPFI